MKTKKVRRHSGYVTPRATIPIKDLMKYDLFINPFYDDWEDYRDGQRDWYSDFKKIKKIYPRMNAYFNEDLYEKRIRMNKKQKKLLKRRKSRRFANEVKK